VGGLELTEKRLRFSSLAAALVLPWSPHDPLSLMPKQFPSGFLVAVLLTASGLLWAVMFFGPLAHLFRLAGGMTPFDIRPWGYSYAEARAFLEALGEQGRAYYVNPELILDTLYPPLLCGNHAGSLCGG
jgi:hypothetical protein